MRDLSLHILDIIENSIRAEATEIRVTVVESHGKDLMEIVVEDNGVGLNVSPEQALDPFYTTKKGKRTGLGLSLFQSAAERAEGQLTIGESDLGGVLVSVQMKLSHIDRSPLGDLAATVSSVVCTNPNLQMTCRLVVDDREYTVTAQEVARELPDGARCGLAVARKVSERIRTGLSVMQVAE